MTDTPFLERRKARASDAVFIFPWFETHLNAVMWAGPKVADPLTVGWLAAEFKSEAHWVWVDEDDTPQAMFKLIDKGHGCAHLTRFAVAPSMRGKGLAAGLMQEIADEAYEAGADSLTLNVYDSNAHARRIYDRLGFKIVEENDSTGDPGGPSVHMRLELEE
ncbi:MAG: GNAT family N-acetyltransferase [Proteobacteria bacterium]|nr:GNAT family N-acetyltransferase [Pseudomonadota bacterium]